MTSAILAAFRGVGLVLAFAIQIAWLFQPVPALVKILPASLLVLSIARPPAGLVVVAGMGPMADAISFFGRHGFEKHVEWKQSLNREANVIFRNRRFYRVPVLAATQAFVEQRSRVAYVTALKLPRVAAVTWMMLRRKIRREAA